MQSILTLYSEDALKGLQKLWFKSQRPTEELYDCASDPHQIKNLAKDLTYIDILVKMR